MCRVVKKHTPYAMYMRAGNKLGTFAMLNYWLADCRIITSDFRRGLGLGQVLQCRQLGIDAIVVLEQTQELGILLEAALAAGVRPAIGVRAKLATRHDGHWGSTSGEQAKFGLRPREIVHVVDTLETAGMLDCLQLLHFHIGSQAQAPLDLSKYAPRQDSTIAQ